jgi:hypothetical protein
MALSFVLASLAQEIPQNVISLQCSYSNDLHEQKGIIYYHQQFCPVSGLLLLDLELSMRRGVGESVVCYRVLMRGLYVLVCELRFARIAEFFASSVCPPFFCFPKRPKNRLGACNLAMFREPGARIT